MTFKKITQMILRISASTMIGLTLLLLAACDSPPVPESTPAPTAVATSHGQVDHQRLLAVDQEPEQWLTSGRDYKLQHYSPLDAINTDTVAQLGFAWEYPITYHGRVQHTLEATPHMVDGVLYTSGPWGTVYAVDAATGQERWRYDPDVDRSWVRRSCCGAVNRGIAIWRGRVYVGTLDGYLLALDAHNGELDWRVDTLVDRTRNYTITSAPTIAGNKVVIGNSGADFGVRGYITAFDTETGEYQWRFYTVPDASTLTDGKVQPALIAAAKTWSANSNWEAGGGGTVWGHMTYDPELEQLYVGVGNASPWPAWHRDPERGDNLYLASIVALDPHTGKHLWHYQTTPGESWDYTATQHMMLAELNVRGQQRKVLMQAPKNGFFYVLDRGTGELLSAANYAPVNWASHIDMATGRPVLTGQGDYQHEPKVVMPAPWGAHNWHPMAFNPDTGLVYIPVIESAVLYVNDRDYRHDPKGAGYGAKFYAYPFPEAYAEFGKDGEALPHRTVLKAWDPITQRAQWQAPGGGGLLSTAGNLVIHGNSQGQLVVYQATNGKRLKTIELGTNIVAAPMSYAINGEQYIAVMAGTGSPSHKPETGATTYQRASRLLAFKLNGGDTPLPPLAQPLTVPKPPAKPPGSESEAQWQTGKALYERYCQSCHRAPGLTPAVYPNLMMMSAGVHKLFDKILLEGLFAAGGMASFADTLSEGDVSAIHSYLIEEQHHWYKQQGSVKREEED